MAKPKQPEIIDESEDENDDTSPPPEPPVGGRVPKANLAPLLAELEGLKNKTEVLQRELTETTRTVTVLLKTIQHFENQYGKKLMPEGKFLGVSF